MRILILSCLTSSLVFLLGPMSSAAEADNDPWAAFRFLMGEWTIEGGPGQESGRFVFQPELNGKILVARGRLERPRKADAPPASREQLMIIYPGGKDTPARAILWGPWEQPRSCTAEAGGDGKSLTFVMSDPGAAEPKSRIRYAAQGSDVLTISVVLAAADDPQGRAPTDRYTARRTPRTNVGLDLPRGYVCYRAAGPITLDGKLDEPAWQDAPWTEAFLDIEGNQKPVPRLETRARMLWDDEYFYVAAHLEEPHVWGTLTKHDSVIFQDNDFEIFIDPDGDNHEYYEIEINALNTEWDLFLKKPYRDGGPVVNEWEIPGLKTGVHVDGTLNDARDRDSGWSVEFAFPWKVLAEYAHRPTPPRDGEQWRINFSRVEWEHEIKDGKYAKVPKRREDNWVWSPQGVVDMHRPEYWGFVQFSTAPPGTDRFKRDPAIPIRERLIEIYQSQRQFHGEKKRWAERVEELGLAPAPSALAGHRLKLNPTSNGFEASISFTPDRGAPEQTWRIDQESRITRIPLAP